MTTPYKEAMRIAEELTARGFALDADEVLEFERSGSLPPSVIGDDYDAARESALEDALSIDTTPIDSDHPRRIR